ncbi:MAG TPA: hypothetical protein DEQ47_16480 [Solibacterales bacterium]|nr:hypothetical protein [Bryobacterales bacterium]
MSADLAGSVPGDVARLRFQVRSALALAVDSIVSHKLRSFLTLLGIIIGVASVILVGSAIEGLGVYAEQSTAKAFGSNAYLVAQIVSTGPLSRRQYINMLKRNKEINLPDDRYLESVNGDNTMYSPYVQRIVDLKRESYISEEAMIIGCSSSLAEVRDLVLVDGRFFTDQEERTRSNVTVIGDDARNNLFPDGSSPLGRAIKINGIDFTVVGVQERLGSAFGRSQDNQAYVPITSFERMYGKPQGGLALFARSKAAGKPAMQASIDVTRAALRNRNHQRPGEDDRFGILTPDAIRGFIDSLLAMVTMVVIPVTCISLVVGGIVIMNIMLVSVTERTREIGIRKALGARRGDILLQVLIEAVLMASLGGAMGVGLGAIATFILAKIFVLSLHITLPYVLLSITVSSIVGIASGWYPASRAAKLDPIAALRSE